MICNEIDEACFSEYIVFVHKLTGITLDRDRSSMLVGRIRKRVVNLNLDGYGEYLNILKFDRKEQLRFINLITTNETYFYRTPRIWDFIEKEFLPSYYSQTSQFVNIWSAASSTGDEAHTLGIVCQSFKDSNPNFGYRILGTDISSLVVQTANDGVYKGRSVERFQQTRKDLFSKYMNGSKQAGYSVSDQIKRQMHFKVHNLFNLLEGDEKFDLILLRNVLIYFTKEDQRSVLSKIRSKLSDRGYLIIGESESLNRVSDDFESISPLIYKARKVLLTEEVS